MSMYDEIKASVQKENDIKALEKRRFFIMMADHFEDSDYMTLHLINERIKELKEAM